MSQKRAKQKKEQVDQEYAVEKIIDKRIRNGVTEYYLSWKGFPASENTWEPVRNLDCPDLIQAFEAREKRTKEYKKTKSLEGPGRSSSNHEPERIVGATNSGGELELLIKWKGTEYAELIPAKIANEKWPQLVIKFYEEHIQFNNCARV